MPLPKSYPATSGQASGTGKRTLSNRYIVGKKLGSGHFGTAFLVTDIKANNERKVLKEISVGDIKPDETVDAVKEARLLANLDNPFIVKFHDSFLEDEKFCIITEYCEGGDLDCKIQSRKASGKGFELLLILDWFIQLTSAVRYIHERRILHRDLKTRNIFLKSNHIKLGDFGISRILMGTSDMATTFTGTPYYMSPEVLKHDGYNSKSDVWSLGAILYELCTLEHAFQAQSLMAVMYKIVERDSPRLPDHFHPELKKLFVKIMNKDPQLRPSATEILQDPFIKSHLEDLKMSIKQTSSKKETTEEAEAIARALNPMKKKQLLQEPDPVRVLSPRERMKLRKQEEADLHAAEIAKATKQSFSEARKRYKERKLKEARVVAPWVEEHPDVFDDPNFSVSLTVNNSCHGNMETSLLHNEHDNSSSAVLLGNGCGSAVETMDNMEITSGGVELDSAAYCSPAHVWSKQDTIPDDPEVAESHYTEYDDFEDDDFEDDYEDNGDDREAMMECMEDVLDLSSDPGVVPVIPQVVVPEEAKPFTPLAREQKIKTFTSQSIHVYGEETFKKLHQFLYEARTAGVDEVTIMNGLKKMVHNTRDCFLIDQLIFLEKQITP